MPKPAAAAESQQLRLQCLQRLQHLQTQFLHIDSPAELADAEQEGGHILALLLHGKHIEPSLLLKNPSNEVTTIVSRGKYYTTTKGEKLLDVASKALGNYTSELPIEKHRSRSGQSRDLWREVSSESFLPRQVTRPIVDVDKPLPEGNYEFEDVPPDFSKGTTPETFESGYTQAWRIEGNKRQGPPIKLFGVQTFVEQDYKQQGKRYSLFVSELIAKLSTEQTTSSPTTTSSHSIEKRLFTDGELVDELDKLLTRAKQYYTAEQVREHLLQNNPGKTIGLTKIKEHPLWKEHNRQWGNNRAPRNTSRQSREAGLRKLVAQQERTEQQTSYRGVDRIADGD